MEGVSNSYQFVKTMGCFQLLLISFFIKRSDYSAFSVLKTANIDNSSLLMLIVTELVYIKKLF